ncbi:MAG: TIM barrel protein [Microbacteriaceae bacterium]|nr:TIM barrel protein [Microbacteriaceae bacterium]
MVRLGTAPDSWGIWFPNDVRQIGWERFLDEVKLAGYDAIELGPWGYLPTDAERLQNELGARGIRLSGGFVVARLEERGVWEQLESELPSLCALVEAVGGEYLAIIDEQYSDPKTGEIVAESELSPDAWDRFVDSAHRIADTARTFGLATYLHPHADTPVEYEEQIETFLERSDPAQIGIVLDVGHHAYRGGDPVRFLEKHRDRVGVIHLKSVDPEVARRVTENRVPWSEAVDQGVFVDPEHGAVDFAALLKVIDATRFDGWAIVEQDMYPAPAEKPLPIARATAVYLRSLGY